MSEPAAADAAPVAEPEVLHGSPVTYSHGQRIVHASVSGYLPLVKKLRADGFVMLVDLCAVDYLLDPPRDLPASVTERYEVVANLLSYSPADRLRVRVQVPADNATVASLYDVYPGAEAMEREAYDLLGIVFEGHPDLSRILLPDDWEGHPLRKDYATGRIPVQFKEGNAGRPSAVR
jgi:NADH-quinone oxidoreductase subunit C